MVAYISFIIFLTRTTGVYGKEILNCRVYLLRRYLSFAQSIILFRLQRKKSITIYYIAKNPRRLLILETSNKRLVVIQLQFKVGIMFIKLFIFFYTNTFMTYKYNIYILILSKMTVRLNSINLIFLKPR